MISSGCYCMWVTFQAFQLRYVIIYPKTSLTGWDRVKLDNKLLYDSQWSPDNEKMQMASCCAPSIALTLLALQWISFRVSSCVSDSIIWLCSADDWSTVCLRRLRLRIWKIRLVRWMSSWGGQCRSKRWRKQVPFVRLDRFRPLYFWSCHIRPSLQSLTSVRTSSSLPGNNPSQMSDTFFIASAFIFKLTSRHWSSRSSWCCLHHAS